ncbi:cytochrome b5-like [Impatiens glandulifera]|uniref:cytochrome b5-like n=1 Tax=Impatiens glandulifera TaxID=253017 RepID=UPI001FB0FB2D|nr:cytochrome b5-like [Impatiens glandulifera]
MGLGSDDDHMNVLSFADVSSHNDSKDCWLIINSRVYDVTKFLVDHPGGEEVLLEAAGKDASEGFEEAGHGSAARLMLDEFYVGEVDPSVVTASTTATFSSIHDLHSPSSSSSTGTSTITMMLLALSLGFFAILSNVNSSKLIEMVSVDEIRDALFSMKGDKSPGMMDSTSLSSRPTGTLSD